MTAAPPSEIQGASLAHFHELLHRAVHDQATPEELADLETMRPAMIALCQLPPRRKSAEVWSWEAELANGFRGDRKAA